MFPNFVGCVYICVWAGKMLIGVHLFVYIYVQIPMKNTCVCTRTHVRTYTELDTSRRRFDLRFRLNPSMPFLFKAEFYEPVWQRTENCGQRLTLGSEERYFFCLPTLINGS